MNFKAVALSVKKLMKAEKDDISPGILVAAADWKQVSSDYKEALAEMRLAMANFELAEPQFVTAAILQTDAAKARVDAVLRDLKARERGGAY